MNYIKSLFYITQALLLSALRIQLFFLFIIPYIIIPKKKEEFLWGPGGIINNKYWSAAIKEMGYNSKTFMEFYAKSINKKEDFDLYYDEVVPKWIISANIRKLLSPFYTMLYILRNAKVIHMPFTGGPLGNTVLWRFEAYIFKYAGIKMFLLPYGGDAYCLSQIIDPSARNALLINYPQLGRFESKIKKRLIYWTKHADIMITGFMIDGMGRWDVPINNFIAIDTKSWESKGTYSNKDGKNGPVKILHAPNHRGAKGTEFLVQAVKELKKDGLNVELILLEKVPNDQVQKIIQEVDILAEQFIFTAYALNAIEGMASGLPVLSNLEHEAYTRVFRRYAFLNECPILSTTPENIKVNLKLLITNPELREKLGRAGRKYVEKYHSYKTAQYLFGSIYDKILHNKNIDLINLFHPILSEYNSSMPLIEHPLFENKLPET